ncbi:DNA polymerase IV, partial [Nonomuraea terrae]
PTTDPATITRTALAILDRFELNRPVRLLGVGVDYTMPQTVTPPVPER